MENDVNMIQTDRTSAGICDRLFQAVLVELLGTHYQYEDFRVTIFFYHSDIPLRA